ncbi:MAG: HIT family protein [Bacteroides sp.]|nr:HIT family protein [Bacteroides sp.]MDE6038801.1 HIT family protein [Paramuribaculum sp.]MBD5319584.1 HIT family protein [Bacteroides sp.]MBD5349550.1 HIT family protein [Bacteroides sp.]MBD5422343.1 HIT family protein [Bacteroides sp.]
MASIFSKIVAGEIPCYKVAEDEKNFAFLDINPMTPGHTLVIPKKEVDYLFDLSDEDYTSLQLFAKRVALAQKAALPCARIAEAVLGMEVPHAHIHLVPIQTEADLNFRNHISLPADEMASIAARIAAEMK